MIKQTAKEPTPTETEPNIPEAGKTTSKTATVKRPELINPLTKACIKREKSTAKVNINGQMALAMMGHGRRIRFVERELTRGLMEGNMLDTGRTITCMVKECIHGMMVGNMKECTKMIRSMGMVFMYGLIKGNLRDNGVKESSMVMESTLSLLWTE